MKKYTIVILVFAVLAIGVGFAFAQKKDDSGNGSFGAVRHFGPPPPPFPPPFITGKWLTSLV